MADHEGGRGGAHLAGEYDVSNLDEVAAALDLAAGAAGPAVVLDLRDVTFLDGSVLDLLAAYDRRLGAEGRRLCVEGTDAHQAKLFRLTGLAHLLARR